MTTKTINVSLASTSVGMPTGRRYLLSIGDEIPDDVLDQMSDEHKSMVVGTPEELDRMLNPPEPEPGTSDDPRLEGAPTIHSRVDTILGWVGDDVDKAAAIYERELRKTSKRKGLIAALEDILDKE